MVKIRGIAAGGEHLLGFAKKKLWELSQMRLNLGLPVLNKILIVDDYQIFIESFSFTEDRLRIAVIPSYHYFYDIPIVTFGDTNHILGVFSKTTTKEYIVVKEPYNEERTLSTRIYESKTTGRNRFFLLYKNRDFVEYAKAVKLTNNGPTLGDRIETTLPKSDNTNYADALLPWDITDQTLTPVHTSIAHSDGALLIYADYSNATPEPVSWMAINKHQGVDSPQEPVVFFPPRLLKSFGDRVLVEDDPWFTDDPHSGDIANYINVFYHDYSHINKNILYMAVFGGANVSSATSRFCDFYEIDINTGSFTITGTYDIWTTASNPKPVLHFLVDTTIGDMFGYSIATNPIEDYPGEPYDNILVYYSRTGVVADVIGFNIYVPDFTSVAREVTDQEGNAISKVFYIGSNTFIVVFAVRSLTMLNAIFRCVVDEDNPEEFVSTEAIRIYEAGTEVLGVAYDKNNKSFLVATKPFSSASKSFERVSVPSGAAVALAQDVTDRVALGAFII